MIELEPAKGRGLITTDVLVVLFSYDSATTVYPVYMKPIPP